jgi:hypothetical protein
LHFLSYSKNPKEMNYRKGHYVIWVLRWAQFMGEAILGSGMRDEDDRRRKRSF